MTGAQRQDGRGRVGDQPVSSAAPAEGIGAPVNVEVAASDPGAALAEDTAGLGGRAARGAAITLVGQATRILLQTVTVVVLARLLSPRDYGLFAIVLVIVGVGEIFRDFGLSNAAVQAKVLTREQRDNLFWVNTGFGVVLSVVVFAAAPLAAWAFHQPALEPITRALALTFTINGVATQFRADLNRRMRFGYLSLCDILGQLGSLIIAVTCAALGAGYWSLVAQQLSQLGLAAMMMVIFARWVPRLPSRDGDIRSFVLLGRQLAATQLLFYLSNNLDTITVGARFGSVSLGIYNRGFSLLMSPLNSLRAPATTVALPVLSRLQGDVDRAGDYIRRGQLTLGYTIVAGLAVTAGASHPIVALLLGHKWRDVSPVVSFLAIAGACSTLAYVGLWVYLSRGLGRDLMHWTLITLGLQAVCILVGSRWGVDGVAAGYAAASAIEWPLSLYRLSRRTPIPLRIMLLAATRVTCCGMAAGGVSRLVSWLTLEQAPILGVALSVASGFAVYTVLGVLSSQVREDLVTVRLFATRMITK